MHVLLGYGAPHGKGVEAFASEVWLADVAVMISAKSHAPLRVRRAIVEGISTI